ncbi:MAG: penicillin-binding transpeptidase domain-containing protein [Alphaproteobacteria bacterium]|nr:penicillin-binding transpeptidase domain-containing protein [Alphaproteobacteria bacterium]
MIFKVFKNKKYERPNLSLAQTISDTYAKRIFDVKQGEGKVSNAISKKYLLTGVTVILFFFITIIYAVYRLQIIEGSNYDLLEYKNIYKKEIAFAKRGTIFDRNGIVLAENISSDEHPYGKRVYAGEAFGNLLGSVQYPQKDTSGYYYIEHTVGTSGIEYAYNKFLQGTPGILAQERDASGGVKQKIFYTKPIDGEDIFLSIDSKIQSALYRATGTIVEQNNFAGGAGALMDIETGELLGLASYPSYNANIFANGSSKEKEKIIHSKKKSLLNRAVSGLYTPGSSIKPFFAVAALHEKIITPTTIINSVPYIEIVSPFDKKITYKYKEYRARGNISVIEALGFSSNIFFYHVGGGFESFRGLGIDKLYEISHLFGFEKQTSLGIAPEPFGVVPNQKWKEDIFNDFWRVGDTYNTVIGQYGWQVTPLQLLRAIGSIASRGILVEPHFKKDTIGSRKNLPYANNWYTAVHKGMRHAVTTGTATPLNVGYVSIAVKSGTAQIDTKGLTNSLVIGFYPYEKPRYAFVFLMESGTEGGAATAARLFFDTILIEAPEYISPQ